MRKLPPLGALRVFEAAARRLSFKDAADELSVTPTAVSHQIRHLEETVGVRLFERSSRQVQMTPAGQQLYPVVRDGFDNLERAVRGLNGSPVAKVATLSSTVAFMARRLVPVSGDFRQAYPDWSLRLDASNALADLDHDADAAIRYGGGRHPGLMVEHLFRDRFAPVCCPGLAVRSLDDLRRSTLIHFSWGPLRTDYRARVWRHWLDAAGVQGVNAEAGLTFNEELHAVQATLAGQGVGLLSLTLVEKELAAGNLVQPFALELDSFSFDLVYSPRRADLPATTILRDWVKRHFGARMAACCGQCRGDET